MVNIETTPVKRLTAQEARDMAANTMNNFRRTMEADCEGAFDVIFAAINKQVSTYPIHTNKIPSCRIFTWDKQVEANQFKNLFPSLGKYFANISEPLNYIVSVLTKMGYNSLFSYKDNILRVDWTKSEPRSMTS